MNLILIFENDFVAERKDLVKIRGRRFQHIKEIHRAKAGDELCIGLLDGKVGSGKITEITNSFVNLEVFFVKEPPQKLGLTLVLALPRPNVVKRILIAAASMGVKKLIFFHCKQVEKSFWLSPVLKEENIKECLYLGLEQAKDTVMPEVVLRKRFKPFVEDELPLIIKGSKAFVAHPEASNLCPRNVKGPITLIIGPEGGFIPYEIEKLKGCGVAPISLGNRILRVETAVVYLIARMV